MRKLLLVLAIGLPAGSALAAIGYSKFSHPQGDYVLEYPSDWKQSFGLQSLHLRPRGRGGSDVRISMERFPAGKGSPKNIGAYIKDVTAAGSLKKVSKRTEATVAGRPSYRLEMTEIAVLSDKYGPLPGPLQEVHILIPFDDAYYVLKIEGIGRPFRQALPEFDRVAARLKLNS